MSQDSFMKENILVQTNSVSIIATMLLGMHHTDTADFGHSGLRLVAAIWGLSLLRIQCLNVQLPEWPQLAFVSLGPEWPKSAVYVCLFI